MNRVWELMKSMKVDGIHSCKCNESIGVAGKEHKVDGVQRMARVWELMKSMKKDVGQSLQTIREHKS